MIQNFKEKGSGEWGVGGGVLSPRTIPKSAQGQ